MPVPMPGRRANSSDEPRYSPNRRHWPALAMKKWKNPPLVASEISAPTGIVPATIHVSPVLYSTVIWLPSEFCGWPPAKETIVDFRSFFRIAGVGGKAVKNQRLIARPGKIKNCRIIGPKFSNLAVWSRSGVSAARGICSKPNSRRRATLSKFCVKFLTPLETKPANQPAGATLIVVVASTIEPRFKTSNAAGHNKYFFGFGKPPPTKTRPRNILPVPLPSGV